MLASSIVSSYITNWRTGDKEASSVEAGSSVGQVRPPFQVGIQGGDEMNRIASQKVCLWLCAALFLTVVGLHPAVAQGPAGPPAPSPELAKLAFFAGDWSCKGRVEDSPFGPAHGTLGNVRVSKEIGGFWYV